MKTVFFVRHGQSQANLAGVYAGITDSPLTEGGRRQAQRLVADIKRLGIRTIISSDLARAFETARILAAGLGIAESAIVHDQRLREVDVGRLTGQPERGVPGTEHAHLPGYIDFCETKNNAMGVEYIGDTQRRMEGLVADLDRDLYQEPVLLVGHDMSGRVLKQVFEGVAINPMALSSFPHNKIIRFVRGRP